MSTVQAAPAYSPIALAAALTPKGTARLQSSPREDPFLASPEASGLTAPETAGGDSQAVLRMALLQAAGAIAVASKATHPGRLAFFS